MSPTHGFLGVVSDTHGLLRPETLAALAGAELILHAGDVGAPEVLERLRELAPVVAVRGNVDRGAWAEDLPEEERVTWRGRRCLLLHRRVDVDPAGAEADLVVTGHSHRPEMEEADGVLWLNPGSAGPRRFRLPVTLARVHAPGHRPQVELVELVPTP